MKIRLYAIPIITAITLCYTPFNLKGGRIDNPSKTEVRRLDSLYTIFTNSKGAERRHKGDLVVAELRAQMFSIDSLLYDSTLSDQDFERSLTKEVAAYLLRNEHFRQCFKAAESLVRQSEIASDTVRMIAGYYLMGFASQKMGEMDKGLKYGLICYELCKVAKDEEMLSSTLNNLGNIYMINNKESLAVTYFTKSLEIERKLGRKEQQSIRLGNISSAYVKMGQLTKALYAAIEGLNLSREIGRLDRIAFRLHQLSEVYVAMGEYKKALEYEKESAAYFKEVESPYGQAIALNVLGEITAKLDNKAEAESYFDQALHFAKEEQNNLIIQQILKNLYLINRVTNPTKALAFLERYISLKDTIFHAENQKQLNDFSVKYETQEKEYELALHKQKLKTAQIEQLFLAITLLLLAVIVVSLIIHRRRSRRQNRDLIESNTTKDKLFSIISHDLKSPVMAQKIAIDAMIKHVSKYDDETINLLTSFSNATESQLSLLQNLLNWANIQTGKMAYNPMPFNLCETINKAKELYSFSAKNKNLQIVLDQYEECIVFADRQMISTVIRNLLNNAIKFSQPNESIVITVVRGEDYTRISISDSGIGISQQQIDNLLHNIKNESKDGTSGEKGSGLGLIICKELLEQNGTILEVESGENRGTTLSFNLKNA